MKSLIKKFAPVAIPIAVALAVVLIFASSVASSLHEIHRLKNEISAVDSAIVSQNQENDALEKKLDSDNINDYAESRAREKLGYIKPGERVYYDVSVGS